MSGKSRNCLRDVRDSNAGAMFGELKSEPNREAVARQNFRKKILVEAELSSLE
ncbi:MAG TPA: hypothetical protein P5267_00155 [Patescibacteria group bacterium]|nr:hypothetical protein [Patescibacteria group bacterium]